MAKQPAIQITIPNPCHQNWQDMDQRTTGRRCAHCNKTVTDFTRFTDAQLLDYFAHHKEKTCGRFTAWQVDRVLQIPPHPHSRLYRMFIALGLTLVFTQVPKARARVLAPVSVVSDQEKITDSTSSLTGVTGRVIDGNHEPVIGAIVEAFSRGEIKGRMATDINGSFAIVNLAPGIYSIKVSFIGLISHTVQNVKVSAESITTTNCILKNDIMGLMEIEVVPYEKEGTPYNDAFSRDVYIKRETVR